jgi:hypothetical protein
MSFRSRALSLRWVDNKSFLGVDRRKQRPSLRFGERRAESADTEAPTLAAALRQLSVRANETNKPAGVQAFAHRTQAIAELADHYRENALARELRRLADLLLAAPKEDWRERLTEALDTISDRYAASGNRDATR